MHSIMLYSIKEPSKSPHRAETVRGSRGRFSAVRKCFITIIIHPIRKNVNS